MLYKVAVCGMFWAHREENDMKYLEYNEKEQNHYFQDGDAKKHLFGISPNDFKYNKGKAVIYINRQFGLITGKGSAGNDYVSQDVIADACANDSCIKYPFGGLA